MNNYDIAALSTGFQRHLELENIHSNNLKNKIQPNNKKRMMSSIDLAKKKSKNMQFNPISNRDFNPSQTQYNFNQKKKRNASLGNRELNYYLPRGGSQYNINSLKKMNNQLEQENLNLMNDNRSIKLQEKHSITSNINNYYKNSRSGVPPSKQLNNNNKNNFNINSRFYNNKNNINTSPNDNMNLYNDNSENSNNYEEEQNNEDDIDNIANEIDNYNNINNNINNNNISIYNLINENKTLKMQINKLFKEKNIFEKKASDLIKVYKEILNENESLKQRVSKMNNFINSNLNTKNENNNNKNQIIK